MGGSGGRCPPRNTRRGANAVEFALVLPLLLLMVAGVVDLGQLLYLADATAAAVAEGARAGALSDPDFGENPIDSANATAQQWWTASEITAPFAVETKVVGAAPDAVIEVKGTVSFDASFRFLSLPTTATYTQTIRLLHQPEPPPGP